MTDTTNTEQPEVHELVGVPDGHEVNGERIVYEYDEDGSFVGWHKEPTGE